MARKTKLQYKTQYMPRASKVTIKSIHTGEILSEEDPYTTKDLYNHLFKSKYRREREWYLIGAK